MGEEVVVGSWSVIVTLVFCGGTEENMELDSIRTFTATMSQKMQVLYVRLFQEQKQEAADGEPLQTSRRCSHSFQKVGEE